VLLRQQSKALGPALKPTKTFRQSMDRRVGGRSSLELVRRISPPNRLRDDVAVNGVWRYSESFDGTRAWYLDKDHRKPTQATGRALAAQRWAGTLLDHLQPLKQLTRLGCKLKDCGLQPTARGQRLRAVQISMLDYFAETVFIDERGRIVAHHWDLPEAGDEEQELEVCLDEWGQHDGLVHPVRSTVLDRDTGGTIAEIFVTDVRLEPYLGEVFKLFAD
jgi:hypothetical protein